MTATAAKATDNMTDCITDAMTTMFRQATQTFQSAVQTGTRLQHEALNACTRTFIDDDMMNDLRERSQKFLEGSIRVVQKNFDESQRLIDAQCRQSMDLVRKAFSAVRPSEKPDMFETTRQFWQQTIDAMRNSAEQMARTNAQAVENWSMLVSQAADGHFERRPENRPDSRTDKKTAAAAH